MLSARIALVATIVVGQLWALTVMLDSWHEGDDGQVWLLLAFQVRLLRARRRGLARVAHRAVGASLVVPAVQRAPAAAPGCSAKNAACGAGGVVHIPASPAR